jgi:hypothetical protein
VFGRKLFGTKDDDDDDDNKGGICWVMKDSVIPRDYGVGW